MLSVVTDYDNERGEINITVIKNEVTIISPSANISLPYLDKPNSTHLIGSDGTHSFNGFINSIEIHNVVLPTIDIEGKIPLGCQGCLACGPW
jgi:hypothetical protein